MSNDLVQKLAEAKGIGAASDGLGTRNTVAFVEEERSALSEKDHSLQVTISTGKLARDGHTLEPGGVDLRQFKRNPVVLYGHNYDSLPIGKATGVRVLADEERIVAKPTLHMETQLSREVWALLKAGVLRAWSVGFIPHTIRELTADELKKAGISVPKDDALCMGGPAEGEEVDLRAMGPHYAISGWELLEFSSVPVPADAGALSDAIRAMHEGGRSVPQLEGMLRSAGYNVPELVPAEVKSGYVEVIPEGGVMLEPGAEVKVESASTDVDPDAETVWLDTGAEERVEEGAEKVIEDRVEETEDFIHVPVRDKGDFIGDTFRTIDISEDEGISAVAGKLKSEGRDGSMVVQKYLFAKEKGWTVEKATKWVADHEKAVEGYLRMLADSGELAVCDVEFLAEGGAVVPIVTAERGVIPFKDYGAADEGADWDAGPEVKAADVDDLRMMCAWYDSEEPDAKGSYKFPHHRQGDKKCVWRGVANAMARVGRSDIPAADKRGVRAHLARHYEQFDKEPPEPRALEAADELEAAGRGMSRRVAGRLVRFADSLDALSGDMRRIAAGAFEDAGEPEPAAPVTEKKPKRRPKKIGVAEALRLAGK
jgi:hypothetical protein